MLRTPSTAVLATAIMVFLGTDQSSAGSISPTQPNGNGSPIYNLVGELTMMTTTAPCLEEIKRNWEKKKELQNDYSEDHDNDEDNSNCLSQANDDYLLTLLNDSSPCDYQDNLDELSSDSCSWIENEIDEPCIENDHFDTHAEPCLENQRFETEDDTFPEPCTENDIFETDTIEPRLENDSNSITEDFFDDIEGPCEEITTTNDEKNEIFCDQENCFDEDGNVIEPTIINHADIYHNLPDYEHDYGYTPTRNHESRRRCNHRNFHFVDNFEEDSTSTEIIECEHHPGISPRLSSSCHHDSTLISCINDDILNSHHGRYHLNENDIENTENNITNNNNNVFLISPAVVESGESYIDEAYLDATPNPRPMSTLFFPRLPNPFNRWRSGCSGGCNGGCLGAGCGGCGISPVSATVGIAGEATTATVVGPSRRRTTTVVEEEMAGSRTMTSTAGNAFAVENSMGGMGIGGIGMGMGGMGMGGMGMGMGGGFGEW